MRTKPARRRTQRGLAPVIHPHVLGREENKQPKEGLRDHAEYGQATSYEENAPVHCKISDHHEHRDRHDGSRPEGDEGHYKRVDQREGHPEPSDGFGEVGVHVETTCHQVDGVRDRANEKTDCPYCGAKSSPLRGVHAAILFEEKTMIDPTPEQVEAARAEYDRTEDMCAALVAAADVTPEKPGVRVDAATLTEALIEELSDVETGPLSDTPYTFAEVNDDGHLELFERPGS